jgi:septal ring factor EnvC (AmiA/AmiB activator)
VPEEKLANGKMITIIPSRIEDLIKLGLMILGPLLIGAMAWQALSDSVDDLAETDATIHRRVSGVESEQEEINDKLQTIEIFQTKIEASISNIKDDIKEIKDAVVD